MGSCADTPVELRPSLPNMTRRVFLQCAALSGLGVPLTAGSGGLSIGVTDWNLKLGAKPDAVPLASRLGFDGVQVSFGRRLVNDRLPCADCCPACNPKSR